MLVSLLFCRVVDWFVVHRQDEKGGEETNTKCSVKTLWKRVSTYTLSVLTLRPVIGKMLITSSNAGDMTSLNET